MTPIAEAIGLEYEKARAAPFFRAAGGGSATTTSGVPAARFSTNSCDHWVEWEWRDQQLFIRSDPFGFIPLFIFQRGDEIAVAPSLQKLLIEGVEVALDEAALSVFLRLGFFIGNDTPFKQIRVAPPGANMVWRNGRWARRGGGSYLVPRLTIARDDAIDVAIQLTRCAVDRRLPAEPFALPLSGGRDSRHLLFELDRRGFHPECALTVPRFPPDAGEDVRIAPRVAAAVGVSHRVTHPRNPPSAAEARKNVATHFCADEHAWFYGMLDEARGRATALYEGIGGSLWTVGWLPDRRAREEWARGRTTSVAGAMLAGYGRVTNAFIHNLVRDSDRFSQAVAIERLAGELDRHSAAPDPGKSFHFWNRMRRELALVPCDLMRQFATVHTPLVDRPLVDFLLSLPPETISPELSRSDKSFHSEAINRAYPKYSHLPFEQPDAGASDARRHIVSTARDVARHLLTAAADAGSRSFRWMQPTYALPRLAYTLLSRRYAESSPWLAPAALYLFQLDRAATGGPRRQLEH